MTQQPQPTSVTLHTNHGDIHLTLYPDQAPKTVENFIGLATGTKAWTDPSTGKSRTDPLYDGVVFHRIIPGFMIQGGDPLGTGTGGPGFAFNDEISPDLNFRAPYMLAMANAGVRGGKGTNGSQFFITVGAATWLQGKHTIFGEVADGPSREVVDAIAAVPTRGQDAPVSPVVIERVSVEAAGQPGAQQGSSAS